MSFSEIGDMKKTDNEVKMIEVYAFSFYFSMEMSNAHELKMEQFYLG